MKFFLRILLARWVIFLLGSWCYLSGSSGLCMHDMHFSFHSVVFLIGLIFIFMFHF